MDRYPKQYPAQPYNYVYAVPPGYTQAAAYPMHPVPAPEVAIKLRFKTEHHRFLLAQPSFAALATKAHAVFPDSTMLKYHDEEDELVTLDSEESFREALRVLAASKRDMLIVHCFAQPKGQPQQQEAPLTRQEVAKMIEDAINAAGKGHRGGHHGHRHGWRHHAQRSGTSDGAVHKGVTCDNCGQSPITGPRFKCAVCPNFDLCAACEMQQVSVDAHVPTHVMLKIPVPTDVLVTVAQDTPPSSQPPVIHHHVTCDGCGMSPISGIRYKCSQCPDYDLCSTCESNGVHAAHTFLKIKKPAPLPSGCTRATRCPRFNSGSGAYANLAAAVAATTPHEKVTPATKVTIPATEIEAPLAAATLAKSDAPVVENVAPVAAETKAEEAPIPTASPAAVVAAPEMPKLEEKVFDLRASFVADINYEDDSVVAPGPITKTWRMKNTGSDSWPVGTKLNFVHGNLLGDAQVEAPQAAPGSEVELTVNLQVPAIPGRYMSVYQLAHADKSFGHRIWCAVVVADNKPEPAVEAEVVADAADDYVMIEKEPEPQPDAELVAALAQSMMEEEEREAEVAKAEAEAALAKVKAEAAAKALEQAEATKSAPNQDRLDSFVARYAQPIGSSPQSTSTGSQTRVVDKQDLALKSLFDMGFYDRSKNISLLNAHKGDLNSVVAALLADSDSDWHQRRH